MTTQQQDPFFIPHPSEDPGSFTKELPTAGEHQAVCCQIHNVGYQMFEGKVSASPKAILVFELDQKMTGGKMQGEPMVISDTFGMYMAENSKLRKALEGWRGRPYQDSELNGFTISPLLKRPCTLLIIHEKKQKGGGMRAKIAGFLPAKSAGWEPTYLETPQWILDEKAKAVPAPVRVDPKGPATHDALGEKLPF